ncbi:HNH endonuclease [Chromohalobacter canadensis]|uniref:HNH endonuclease signature motif containing protein n=1 Tax=Chromohalobacter canadensis TaxID=141389 RepID=UPI003D68759A
MKIKASATDLNDQQIQQISHIYEQATLLQQKLRACVVCDDDLELQVHVDHIIPLAKGGRHVPDNLQILSGRENIDKGVNLCLDTPSRQAGIASRTSPNKTRPT